MTLSTLNSDTNGMATNTITPAECMNERYTTSTSLSLKENFAALYFFRRVIQPERESTCSAWVIPIVSPVQLFEPFVSQRWIISCTQTQSHYKRFMLLRRMQHFSFRTAFPMPIWNQNTTIFCRCLSLLPPPPSLSLRRTDGTKTFSTFLRANSQIYPAVQ